MRRRKRGGIGAIYHHTVHKTVIQSHDTQRHAMLAGLNYALFFLYFVPAEKQLARNRLLYHNGLNPVGVVGTAWCLYIYTDECVCIIARAIINTFALLASHFLCTVILMMDQTKQKKNKGNFDSL